MMIVEQCVIVSTCCCVVILCLCQTEWYSRLKHHAGHFIPIFMYFVIGDLDNLIVYISFVTDLCVNLCQEELSRE